MQRTRRFKDLLDTTAEEPIAARDFETRSAKGRPLGTLAFLAAVERALGRLRHAAQAWTETDGAGGSASSRRASGS